jgi:hypothetical protein
MAGNGRRRRSRRDYAADVALAVRAGVLSPQDLISRPASGRVGFAQVDVEQLKEAMAAPPTVACGSGRRRAHTEPWSPNARQTASESHWRGSAQIGPRCLQPPAEHDGSRHFSHPASCLIARSGAVPRLGRQMPHSGVWRVPDSRFPTNCAFAPPVRERILRLWQPARGQAAGPPWS